MEIKSKHRKKLTLYILEESKNNDFKITEEVLAGAAGRGLGAIISKFKCLKNVGFNTFSKMYQVKVVPIVDYSSSVWGYANYPKVPLLGLEGDMGWENCKVRYVLAIIRL